MRVLTDIMLFLVTILAVIPLYVFRQQAFTGLQQKFGAALGREPARVASHIPVRPTDAPATAKPARARTRTSSTASEIQVTMTVIPIEPTPPIDSTLIGMKKEKLSRDFWKPDVVTSSREGGRFLETFIYLEDMSKATLVRLVNGTVVSVTTTKTVGPPLLVPRADGTRRTSVFLTSDSM